MQKPQKMGAGNREKCKKTNKKETFVEGFQSAWQVAHFAQKQRTVNGGCPSAIRFHKKIAYFNAKILIFLKESV